MDSGSDRSPASSFNNLNGMSSEPRNADSFSVNSSLRKTVSAKRTVAVIDPSIKSQSGGINALSSVKVDLKNCESHRITSDFLRPASLGLSRKYAVS
ncbi:hypothetical protein SprV_0501943800 [Sparganum proliferum]